MRRLAFALAVAVGAYLVAAVVGWAGTMLLSSNPRDRELEAAMSAAFFYGPAGAVVGLVVGWWKSGRAPR